MSGSALLRFIYRSAPPPGQRFFNWAWTVARSFCGLPLKRSIFGEKARYVPPLYLMQDGARDYVEFSENGLAALNRFLASGLKPSDRILNIGCGVGRKTIPLLDCLTTGSYEGFHVVGKQVRWCAKRITPRYPHFRFQHVEI